MTDSDAFGARSVAGRARALLHRDAGPVPATRSDPVAEGRPGQPTAATLGMVVGGRYRLTGQRAPVLGAQMWRAVDEVLVRDVGMLVVRGSDARAPALLAAARRAATVADQHFLRVYDAGTCRTDPGSPLVYVVQEWVSARSLSSLLAGGPLGPERSALVARELAEAVAAAHQQGLTHRSVTPDRVLVSANGTVRVVGLEVAAALAGLPPGGTAEDRTTDVRAVGAVLYAGLTGHWPLDPGRPGDPGLAQPAVDTPRGQLRPAPRRHGRVFGPRQVRPGIPRSHDVLALRALGRDAGQAGGPVTSARELAGLLGQVTDPSVDANTPLPQLRDLAARAALPASVPAAPGAARATGARPAPRPESPDARGGGDAPAPVRPARSRGVTVTAVAVLALVALGLALLVWQVSGELGVRGSAGVLRDARIPLPGDAAAGAPAAVPFVSTGATVPISSVRDFDPEGADGRENPAAVALATDADPSTAWRTSRYSSARLGGLKSGVGLLVDLGSVHRVAQVDLGLLGTGTGVQLRTAGIATDPPADLSGFGVVATDRAAGPDASLRPDSPVLTRYLLVWLTELPHEGNWYRGGIRTLDVRG